MARKNGPTSDDRDFSSQFGSTSGVDLYPDAGFEGEMVDSARLADEPEAESPFLRAQKRVPVRRGPIPKKAANRLKIALICAGIVVCVVAVVFAFYRYGTKSWRFQIDSSDSIQVSGNQNVTRDDIVAVFGEDIARNVFRVSLEERKRQLEQIPWIESATVMRYLPNRMAVSVKERTPVASVQTESHSALIDANGVVMEIPENTNYSFPVLTGFSDADPLSTRAARMKIYSTLIREVDAEGSGYSQDFSEVDVTNPEDVRVVMHSNDSVHLANHKFLEQYKRYLELLPQCRTMQGTANVDLDLRFKATVCKPVGAAAAPAASSSIAQPQQSQPTATPAPSHKAAPKPASRWKRKH